MKLFTALGPGDIVGAHRAQMNGESPAETAIIFSGQVIEYCREQAIELLAVSYNRRSDMIAEGRLHIENRPRCCEDCGGIRYHFSRIAYGCYLALRAKRFGADLAIVDSGSAHYFALALFKVLRIPIAINFHNTLWPNGFEPTRALPRLLLSLNALFFRYVVVGTMGVSPECGRQVRQLAKREPPFFEYRTQYRSQEFQSIRGECTRKPFRVIYVGRIERNKGVLDIAAIAQWLRGRSRVPCVFEICGQGAALPELRETVMKNGLGDVVHVHGRVPRPELFRLFRNSHAVIVPTRSDFCEGLPAVCAEAVLGGLPIVTSRLSNALSVLAPAIAEAEPENIESFANAILQLVQDQSTYERLSMACPELARQFCDRSQGYPAALDRLMAHVFAGWNPLSDYDRLFTRVG